MPIRRRVRPRRYDMVWAIQRLERLMSDPWYVRVRGWLREQRQALGRWFRRVRPRRLSGWRIVGPCPSCGAPVYGRHWDVEAVRTCAPACTLFSGYRPRINATIEGEWP